MKLEKLIERRISTNLCQYNISYNKRSYSRKIKTKLHVDPKLIFSYESLPVGFIYLCTEEKYRTRGRLQPTFALWSKDTTWDVVIVDNMIEIIKDALGWPDISIFGNYSRPESWLYISEPTIKIDLNDPTSLEQLDNHINNIRQEIEGPQCHAEETKKEDTYQTTHISWKEKFPTSPH